MILLTVGGCATGGAAGGDEPDRLSLELGTALTTMRVDPPNLVGNAGALIIKDDLIQGPGGLRLRLDESGAEGSGPAGAATLTFKEDPAAGVEIAGTWNGAPVRFKVAAALVDARFRRGGETFCDAKLEREPKGPYVGRAKDPYVGRMGCGGEMRAEGGARLDIPFALEAWLTPRQLATVLLILLSQASIPGDNPVSRGYPMEGLGGQGAGQEVP